MARWTSSKFIGYVGKIYCYKCGKIGYGYIKQLFDGSRLLHITHIKYNKETHKNKGSVCYI